MSIRLYCVFDHSSYLRCYDACTRSVACYARAKLLPLENLFLDCERTCFSCDVIASRNGATFEFLSTGWYKVRDTPIKRCLTWDRTKYGSTTCSTTTVCSMHGTTASLMTTSEIVFRLIGIKMSQVSMFTIIGIM